MRVLLTIALFCIVATPTHAGIFNAQTATLENGLEIVVIPNHRAPIVHHMLWYKAGSAQELTGYSGVAHFLEHLLFKGTDHKDRPLKAGEFSKIIRNIGGQDNAFTSTDYTAFFQTTSKQHLNTIMQMEADRIRRAMPPEKHVLSERAVVIEERNQRTENNPKARFYEQMQATLFPNHPYGRPVIGLRDEIQKMNEKDTRAFYNQWYHPNQAILVITGDVTLPKILPDIKAIYGVVPKGPENKRHFPVVPNFEGKTTITQHSAQVKQAQWMRAIRAPSFHQNKEHSLALQVLENILDGGATTRLYKKLVVEDKKAVSVSLSYSADKYDLSSIWISAIPTEGTSMQELESAIETLLTDIIENGVTDQEIKEAKTRLKNAAIFARDSLSGPAHIIGRALTTGSSLNDTETWDTQIETVTKKQIQNVSNIYLKSQNLSEYRYITGHLLPEIPKPEIPETKDK